MSISMNMTMTARSLATCHFPSNAARFPDTTGCGRELFAHHIFRERPKIPGLQISPGCYSAPNEMSDRIIHALAGKWWKRHWFKNHLQQLDSSAVSIVNDRYMHRRMKVEPSAMSAPIMYGTHETREFVAMLVEDVVTKKLFTQVVHQRYGRGEYTNDWTIGPGPVFVANGEHSRYDHGFFGEKHLRVLRDLSGGFAVNGMADGRVYRMACPSDSLPISAGRRGRQRNKIQIEAPPSLCGMVGRLLGAISSFFEPLFNRW